MSSDESGRAPLYAKVAVSSINYGIDRPYDYKICDSMAEYLRPGMRVIVPFGRGNRKTEATVLQISDKTKFDKVKSVLRVLDEEPVISREMINLLLRIRKFCFCTFYDVLKAALPAGLWFHLEQKLRLVPGLALEGDSVLLTDREKLIIEKLNRPMTTQALGDALSIDPMPEIKSLMEKGIIETETAAIRGVGDKTIRIASLAVSVEEAEEYIKSNSKRAPYHAKILEFLLTSGEAAEGEIVYYTGCSNASIRRLAEKGLIILDKKEVMRRPEFDQEPEDVEQVVLNTEQKSTAEGLISLADSGESAVALLFGVTGSGKTQVYMSVIEHVLNKGQTALVLVPEIALTPQLMRIFRSRFGDRTAILHSMLSTGQRSDEWKRIKRGEAQLVLGTRSAIFAPLENIGVIVIDEEQEHTYKSENVPRYHARDVAKYRAYYNKALLILASATPSVESYYSAQTGKYNLFVLSERYNKGALPEVLIADMRKELVNANPSTISALLKSEISKNIENGEQTILFLNRRGNSRRLVCGECGAIPECTQCTNSMTYHSANGRLMCHLCGCSHTVESRCPVCGGEYKFVGAGTQKCEEDLKQLFDGVEVLRMDSDTTSARRSHEEILSRFREEKVPILLGTQMVAKGLDFDNVTLVGVIDADQSLYAEDYRSHEQTFSLITQVVGRAGRGRKPGRAVLQTFTPENPILLAAARQDYEAFFLEEIRLRERLCTPPFCEILLLTVSAVEEMDAMKAALQTGEFIRNQVRRYKADIQVMGPTQASIYRVRNRYRFQITLATKDTNMTCKIVSLTIKMFNQEKSFRDCLITADFKPNSIT
jgi:primosomal protein N' (replication factor Y)